MATVTVEIDIDANGGITATPNPVFVRTGDRLFIHVRSNRSKGTQFNVVFPGGTKSPFGARDTTITVPARRCLGGGSGVDWPPKVDRATVQVSVSGSPVIGELDIDVLREDAQLLDVPDDLGRKPCVVQSFHFPGTPVGFPGGGGEAVQKREKSTDCGPGEVSAGPTWGPWRNNRRAAVDAALEQVRDACEAQCGGKCSSGDCKYLEQRSAVPLIEENPQDRTVRAQASSSGTCQCE